MRGEERDGGGAESAKGCGKRQGGMRGGGERGGRVAGGAAGGRCVGAILLVGSFLSRRADATVVVSRRLPALCPSQDLGLPTVPCVESALQRAFLDKVIPDVGLITALYDIVSIGPGLVHPSEGGAHRDVRFRVVAFRPSIGEMLRGSVVRCDEARGVQVSLGFFDDLWIPPRCLPKGTSWDADAGAFRWIPAAEDEEGEGGGEAAEEDLEEFFFDQGFDVRCKVVNLRYERRIAMQDAPGLQGGGLLGRQAGQPPPAAGRNGPTAANGAAPEAADEAAEEKSDVAVMTVTAVADGSGLGMVHWYAEDDEEGEAAEQMDQET